MPSTPVDRSSTRRLMAVVAIALLGASLLAAAGLADASRGSGQIRGYVTDASFATPIAGATVRLDPQTPRGEALPWMYELAADGSGYYVTTAVPATYRVTVSHDSYEAYVGYVTVGSLQTTWANASLAPAGARTAILRGTVTETGTGAPITVGRMIASPPFGFPTNSYRNESALNASGSYEMALVPGTYDVYTDGIVGYASDRVSYASIFSGVRWMNFTLDPHPFDAWINGTVRDASTSAVLPNATVSGQADGLYVGPVATDAAGTFSLNVPEGSTTIAADAVGYALTLTSEYVWSGSTAFVTLYLEPLSATIRGYVTNSTSGAPVPGAVVSASDFDRFYDQSAADATGYYELGVMSDFLDLRATAPGYGTTRSFAYPSDGQTVWWNVTLYPIIADVVGYAVDALDGSRLPNMTVLVADGITGYYNFTSTDATGFYRARLTAVPFLIATVSGTGVYAGGFAYGNAARGGTVWVNVTVQRLAATVRVNVTDGLTGAPVPDATISLSWIGLYVDWATSDANGSVLLDAPATRTIAIFGSKSGYDFAYAFVDLAPGVNFVDLVLYPDLPTDVTLRGYVTNETGAPISSARVDVSGYGDLDDWDYTDSTGYYEMRIVAAPQRVVATTSGHTGNSTTVSPASGETVWANFTLRPDPDRPVFLSLRANPNASVSPTNPTRIVADLAEASPDWASGTLYRMVSRSGNLGTFVQLRTLLPGEFDTVQTAPDRYDLSVPWDARATGGWIRDASRAEWWPVSTGIQVGSYAIMGSWTNGTASADPAIAGFDQFTGRLQFVFSAAYGIITPEMDPTSTFRPTAITTKYDLTTGVQTFEPAVRGGPFSLGSLRLDYDGVVPSGTYAASVYVYDHADRWNSAVTFFTVDTGPDIPVANAGGDMEADEDTSVSFDGSASMDGGGIVNWTWTFTDGTAQTLYGPSATYVFATPGVYVITLTVRDGDGNTGLDTVTVTIRDVTPPVASIVAPANNATVSGVIDIIVNASDNGGVVRVEFFVDGQSVGNDTSPPYSFSLDASGLGAGAHTIRVVAYDGAGHTAEASRTVSVALASGGGVSPLVLFGEIGILMAVIVVAAAYLLLRRRRAPMPASPPNAETVPPAAPEATVESLSDSPPEGEPPEPTLEELDRL